MLSEHGYYSACIGKWHLGWTWPSVDGSRINDLVPVGQYEQQVRTEFGHKVDFSGLLEDGPTTRGFDEYFGDDVPNFPPYTFIENDLILNQPIEDKPPEMFGHDGSMAPGWRLDMVMPSLTDRAVRFIRERASESRSFFLYFSLTAPHTPIAPDRPFLGKSEAGLYGDYVHQVDWSVGQVMEELSAHGLDQNTLFIFTSDNGSPQRDGTGMSGPVGSVKERYGHDPSRPWRGMKGDIWEGGHRVPFIARWPGRIRPSSMNPSLICLTDLMATLARLVGHNLTADAAEDSFDMLSVFEDGKAGETSRRAVVLHSNTGVFSIREGEWKLILGKSSGGFTRYDPPEDAPEGQLYNLADDPSEWNNLYRSRPEVVQKLVSLLRRYKSEGRSAPF
jgi:arylsulfatase A-like enzyme